MVDPEIANALTSGAGAITEVASGESCWEAFRAAEPDSPLSVACAATGGRSRPPLMTPSTSSHPKEDLKTNVAASSLTPALWRAADRGRPNLATIAVTSGQA